jgi:hypothetical protein
MDTRPKSRAVTVLPKVSKIRSRDAEIPVPMPTARAAGLELQSGARVTAKALLNTIPDACLGVWRWHPLCFLNDAGHVSDWFQFNSGLTAAIDATLPHK